MMTHYQSQKQPNGKFYIRVFSESKGIKTSDILPEAHESHEAAHEWAKAHALPILEAQAVYYSTAQHPIPPHSGQYISLGLEDYQ